MSRFEEEETNYGDEEQNESSGWSSYGSLYSHDEFDVENGPRSVF